MNELLKPEVDLSILSIRFLTYAYQYGAIDEKMVTFNSID